MDYEESLMIKAAWYYYFEDMTQQQVAGLMGITRMRVMKLLEKARQTGIIQFRLRKDGEKRMLLERRLMSAFHLKDAFVVPAPIDPSAVNAGVAEAASLYISERLRDDSLINIGYGDTPSRILNNLATIAEQPLTCVSLTGGVSYYLPDTRSNVFNAKLHLIPAPLLTSSPEMAEALRHGGIAHRARVRIQWVQADELTGPDVDVEAVFRGVHGILVPGGFGNRGIEGKMVAVRYAREHNIPYLGICLGMQVAVMEFARHVCGLEGASSTEFAPDTPWPVIDIMEEQKGLEQTGGTMRLGAYRCRLTPDSGLRALYGADEVFERHRHRYEFNNAYIETFAAHGLRVAGVNPERELVEAVELTGHPWFVGVQFHPEFKSRPNRPHPLFIGLIGAAIRRAEEEICWKK